MVSNTHTIDKHVGEWLSGYIDGELTQQQRQRGEIHEYAKLIGESREQCLDRMTIEATELGANAIITTRFTTSVMMGGAAELLAVGTAVIVEDL